MTDKQKILKVLEIQGVTVSNAEQLCGFGVGTLSKMLARDGSLHKDNIKKFQRTFKVNEEWWKMGKGDIFEEEPKSGTETREEQSEFGRLTDRLIDTVEATFDSLKIELDKKNKQIEWLQSHIDKLTTQDFSPAKQGKK